MGHSIYSYVVFGIKTPRSNMKQLLKIRSCTHNVTEDMNFCPDCGKPIFVENVEEILEAMSVSDLSYFYCDYQYDTEVILGFCLSKTSSSYDVPVVCLEPTSRMTLEILDFCKKHNLPHTENDILTYVVTYHSY